MHVKVEHEDVKVEHEDVHVKVECSMLPKPTQDYFENFCVVVMTLWLGMNNCGEHLFAMMIRLSNLFAS